MRNLLSLSILTLLMFLASCSGGGKYYEGAFETEGRQIVLENGKVKMDISEALEQVKAKLESTENEFQRSIFEKTIKGMEGMYSGTYKVDESVLLMF